MAKRKIESPQVFRFKGPYVQGVEVTSGRLVFTSGFTSRDPAGVPAHKGDIRAQTRQCLENIRSVLEAAGGSLRDIVKVTVFLRDVADYDGMNEVRIEMLAGIPFASTTVEARLHSADALVEIEAVAVVE